MSFLNFEPIKREYFFILVVCLVILCLSGCSRYSSYKGGIKITPDTQSYLHLVKTIQLVGNGSGFLERFIQRDFEASGLSLVTSEDVTSDISIVFDIKKVDGIIMPYGDMDRFAKHNLLGIITAYDRNKKIICQDEIKVLGFIPDRMIGKFNQEIYDNHVKALFIDDFARGNIVQLIDTLINNGPHSANVWDIYHTSRQAWGNEYYIDSGILRCFTYSNYIIIENLLRRMVERAQKYSDQAARVASDRILSNLFKTKKPYLQTIVVKVTNDENMLSEAAQFSSHDQVRYNAAARLCTISVLKKISQGNDFASRIARIRHGIIDPVVKKYTSQELILSIDSEVGFSILGDEKQVTKYLLVKVKMADKTIASGGEYNNLDISKINDSEQSNAEFSTNEIDPENILFQTLMNLSVTESDLNEIIRKTSSPSLKQAAKKNIQERGKITKVAVVQ